MDNKINKVFGQGAPPGGQFMNEIKLFSSPYSLLLQFVILIFCFQFNDEDDPDFWKLGLILQGISCVVHPSIEFILSAKVRYFIKDRIEAFCGGVVSDTVIVT